MGFGQCRGLAPHTHTHMHTATRASQLSRSTGWLCTCWGGEQGGGAGGRSRGPGTWGPGDPHECMEGSPRSGWKLEIEEQPSGDPGPGAPVANKAPTNHNLMWVGSLDPRGLRHQLSRWLCVFREQQLPEAGRPQRAPASTSRWGLPGPPSPHSRLPSYLPFPVCLSPFLSPSITA